MHHCALLSAAAPPQAAFGLASRPLSYFFRVCVFVSSHAAPSLRSSGLAIGSKVSKTQDRIKKEGEKLEISELELERGE